MEQGIGLIFILTLQTNRFTNSNRPILSRYFLQIFCFQTKGEYKVQLLSFHWHFNSLQLGKRNEQDIQ